MDEIIICPECEIALIKKSKHCSCGWFQQEPQYNKQLDDQCQHVVDGVRCSSVGTVSPSTKKIGVWYCGKHGRVVNKAFVPKIKKWGLI